MKAMKTLSKSLFTAFAILSLALIGITCFDATRDNPWDPANAPRLLRVDPGTYYFGSINVGSSSTIQTFTVTNVSSEYVNVTNVQSSNSSVFQLSGVPSPLPSLNPGSTFTFQVQFTPTAAGNISGSISIAYNTITKSGTVSAQVTGDGTGVAAALYQYYVRQSDGNDSNAGTSTAPFATIGKAITVAIPGNKIAVAQGIYNITTELTLAGVELYGGFLTSSWDEAQRIPGSNITEIKDGRAAGGTDINPNATVVLSPSTSNTIIDGFTITAGNTGYTSAVKIITVSANSLNYFIRRNVITGNTSGTVDTTYGIFYNDTLASGGTGTVTIERNDIHGGNALGGGGSQPKSYAVYHFLNVAKTININIWNNTINGGTSNGTIVDSFTYGIYCAGLSPKIFNNTVYTGRASGGGAIKTSSGIYIGSSSSPSIINNIIFGKNEVGVGEYGIFEGGPSFNPSQVDNNDVYNCNNALYHDGDGFDFDFVAIAGEIGNFYNGAVTYLSTPRGYYNQDTIATFIDLAGGDWHLSFPNASNDLIKIGGTTLAEFNIDKDGNTRTAQWSIGAYEHD